MAVINTLFIIIIIMLWKTTTGKNIVIDGWLNGLSQELPNTIFIIIMIKLVTITKLLSYQYAIYYYFSVETTTGKTIVIDGWLNGLSQEVPNTILILLFCCVKMTTGKT